MRFDGEMLLAYCQLANMVQLNPLDGYAEVFLTRDTVRIDSAQHAMAFAVVIPPSIGQFRKCQLVEEGADPIDIISQKHGIRVPKDSQKSIRFNFIDKSFAVTFAWMSFFQFSAICFSAPD